MTKEDFEFALRFLEEQNVPAQITFDGYGNYTIDLQSEIHTKVLFEEMLEAGKLVNKNPKPYYARLS